MTVAAGPTKKALVVVVLLVSWWHQISLWVGKRMCAAKRSLSEHRIRAKAKISYGFILPSVEVFIRYGGSENKPTCMKGLVRF